MEDSKTIDRLIRIGLLILMVTLSAMILAPFMIILIWGIIIAVALFPFFNKTVKAMGGKRTLTAVLFTLLGLAIIVVPSIFLTTSSATGLSSLQAEYEKNGHLPIPEPEEGVKEWPVIGERVYYVWDQAAHNLREFLKSNQDQLEKFASWLFQTLASLGITIFQFIASMIIAGVLLTKADWGKDATTKFANRIVGNRAQDFIVLTGGTIRSVVQGILGIALIQSLATALLSIIFGIPLPGLWALAVLILAIMQLPPLLVLGPMIIWVFSEFSTTPAVIFTIFAVLISISDSLLKPVFLGRGVDIPMLVVLLGAIGGMLVFGILGLFVGAVVLALSYKLSVAWLEETA